MELNEESIAQYEVHMKAIHPEIYKDAILNRKTLQWVCKRKPKEEKRLTSAERKRKESRVYIGDIVLMYGLTELQWKVCKAYFDNKCAYCGKEAKLTFEHFIPISKGGRNSVTNILPACLKCNESKHNNGFFKWYPKQKFYDVEREAKILRYLHYDKEEGRYYDEVEVRA